MEAQPDYQYLVTLPILRDMQPKSSHKNTLTTKSIHSTIINTLGILYDAIRNIVTSQQDASHNTSTPAIILCLQQNFFL